jgi:hypothetical protein
MQKGGARDAPVHVIIEENEATGPGTALRRKRVGISTRRRRIGLTLTLRTRRLLEGTP